MNQSLNKIIKSLKLGIFYPRLGCIGPPISMKRKLYVHVNIGIYIDNLKVIFGPYKLRRCIGTPDGELLQQVCGCKFSNLVIAFTCLMFVLDNQFVDESITNWTCTSCWWWIH